MFTFVGALCIEGTTDKQFRGFDNQKSLCLLQVVGRLSLSPRRLHDYPRLLNRVGPGIMEAKKCLPTNFH